jgi:hypothetical protein
LRIGHRKASEADGIYQLKDGGVGADAKRKREDGDGGKHRSASKRAQTVLCVADDVFHKWLPGGSILGAAPRREAEKRILVNGPLRIVRDPKTVGAEPYDDRDRAADLTFPHGTVDSDWNAASSRAFHRSVRRSAAARRRQAIASSRSPTFAAVSATSPHG